jgi:hypothetical protein
MSAQRRLSTWSDDVLGQRVEANGQGLGFLVRSEIDLGAVDDAQQTASIIMAAHRLGYDLRLAVSAHTCADGYAGGRYRTGLFFRIAGWSQRTLGEARNRSKHNSCYLHKRQSLLPG